MPTLSDIIIYPLKSAKGIQFSTAVVEETGLQYDRNWMLVDGDYRFISQREYPKMALLETALSADALTFSAPGQKPLSVPLEASAGEALKVTVWDDRCTGLYVSKLADAWFSEFLGMQCTLVRMPPQPDRVTDASYNPAHQKVSFSDGFPLLVISEASLDVLNQRLETPVPMSRFRPNLVLRGTEPFAEDHWLSFKIGNVDFNVKKPCARCVVTTINQETAAKGKEPLATLSKFRKSGSKILFGQNVMPSSLGEIKVGSEVRVVGK